MGETHKDRTIRLYKEQRSLIFNKYNGYCAYCGCKLYDGNFQVDHLIPKRRGAKSPFHSDFNKEKGSDNIENLMPSCCSCNASKSDLDIEDFRDRVKDRLKRLNDYSTEYNIAKRFGLVKEVDMDVVFYYETYKPIPF